MKKEPFWIRTKQKYCNLRARLLLKLGICFSCGWRFHHGNWACDKCYWEEIGSIE